MRLFKKTGIILLAAALTLTLAACGGGQKSGNTANSGGTQSEGGGQSASSNEPVKLRIMWWGAQERHDATLKALEKYSELNPHITFEPEYSGWDGYWDKLSTQVAAKNAPDIIQMDPAYFADYVQRNLLADLSEGIDTSNMDEALVNSGMSDGKLYAVALGNNAIGLGYNKQVLEKLGMPLPKDGWTWEEFFQYLRDAKAKAGDQYISADLTARLDIYGIFQMSRGLGYYVTQDGKFNMDKDTWLEWANTFAELRKEGVVPPGDINVTDKELDPALDLLVNGSVLFRNYHAAQAGALDSMNPGVYGMVTMPRGQEGAGWLKPSMYWSVSADSPYIEEAKKFIDWFINDKEAGEILGTTRGVPVSKPVLEHLSPNFTEADKMGIQLIESTAPIAQPFQPDPKGWQIFREKDYSTLAEKIIFGEVTPEKAWEELVAIAKDYE